jgi:flagellar FliJ protein
MSQSNLSALEWAIRSAAEKHQAAEKILGQTRNRLRSAEATYATLDNFRGEYANRLRSVTRFDTTALEIYHRFLGKLEHALDSQKNDVTQAGNAVEQSQSAWFATLQRLKAMELLRDRRTAAAQIRQKRQEQKQSDEFAARSSRLLRRHDSDEQST